MLVYFSAIGYLITLIGLVIFSYTQADTGLYVFPDQRLKQLQDNLINIGSHERFITGSWFLIILMGMFLGLAVFWQNRHSFSNVGLIILILLTFSLLTTAYPAAFSHDIFNYAFDAKILNRYHLSPWQHAPKEFPGDPLYRFVHWPTTKSRYGPTWVGLSTLVTAPFGDQIVPVIFSLKIFQAGSYLLILILLVRLAKKLQINQRSVLVFFAFNPLILLEFLVSPHTDTLMTLFTLLVLDFALAKKPDLTGASFLLSIGVKIVSLPILGALAIYYWFGTRGRLLVWYFFAGAVVGSLIISARWSINPWYFTLPITLGALLWNYNALRYFLWSLSAAAVVRYLPYFYLGFFNPGNKIRAELFLLFLAPFCVWLTINLIRTRQS